MPQRRWLEHYAAHFATVENNNTFYRLPARETFAGWRERTSADFVMAVKASRFLTHVRRLRDPAEPARRLPGACPAPPRVSATGLARCCSSFRRTSPRIRCCSMRACMNLCNVPGRVSLAGLPKM